MRKLEAFLGVRVLTYCLMSNHFHILVEIPDADDVPDLTQDRLLELLPILYDDEAILHVTQELQRAAAAGDDKWKRNILDRYQNRMGRLDVFIKELKQRFTQWFNRNNERCGTLWEDRYKSVLVEGSENALITMAAYIDLNPVRAGLVDDPKDYHWSGYGEASGGKAIAREGLGRMLAEALHGEFEGKSSECNWQRTSSRYRLILYSAGEERPADEHTGQKAKKGFSREQIEEVIAAKGTLPLREILRCRVRYFCDGAVFGTTEFVNEVFNSNRHRHGPRRKTGARKMQGAEWGELCVLRDLQKDVISPS